MNDYIIWFDKLGMQDVEQVGGKNASLGEMISKLSGSGVLVPGGFATTARAFREFCRQSGLSDRIDSMLGELDVDDVPALTACGAGIRNEILATPFPAALEQAIGSAWQELGQKYPGPLSVAVRSSATAEDLPDASFAGQQETYLNVRGLSAVMTAIRQVFASLYNDRAIAYRVHQGFDHRQVALSAGIQKMVRSDVGAAGVAFTLDTESGFPDVVFVTSSYGLGETVVQGAVNPDEFYVYKGNLAAGRPAILRRTLGDKAIMMTYGQAADAAVETVPVDAGRRIRFSLSDAQVEQLARHAVTIEQHYGRAMDIEWALDGEDRQLYIVQARPETVQSRGERHRLEKYRLLASAPVLVRGRAIGQRIGTGVIRIIDDIGHMDELETGDILVTDMTDPDWEPIMKRAAAIVTNRGGRTCHAAIIARELGVPAVVGCGDATQALESGSVATVCCAEGDEGKVYAGQVDFEVTQNDTGQLPGLPVKIMMNVGNPGRAFDFCQLPNHGVGLARLEFIISTMIGIHPRALLEFDSLPGDLRQQITARTSGYADPVSFYIDKIAEGVSTLAAAFAGKPVIVRLSDFKSNEYYNLLGGNRYEPSEENPMIGYRGAARYLSDDFRACFELECRAIRKVRNDMGFRNVEIMIPFVRTLGEARGVSHLLASNGLQRGRDGLRVIMMCELPSNALQAEAFLEYFDGFSIGSNDMTQLTLGLDRDSALVAGQFDERDPAVRQLLQMAIQAARAQKKYVGICGQGPSDYPDFAAWLLEQGIGSISLNPDSLLDTWLSLAAHDRSPAVNSAASVSA